MTRETLTLLPLQCSMRLSFQPSRGFLLMDNTIYQNESPVMFAEVPDQEALAAEMALYGQTPTMTEKEESEYHAYFGSK